MTPGSIQPLQVAERGNKPLALQTIPTGIALVHFKFIGQF
jgi:hypothetical protein